MLSLVIFLFKDFIFSKLDARVKRHNILGIVSLIPVLGSRVRIWQFQVWQAKGSHPHLLNDKQKVFNGSWICPEKFLARTLCPPVMYLRKYAYKRIEKTFLRNEFGKGQYTFYPIVLSRFAKKNKVCQKY